MSRVFRFRRLRGLQLYVRFRRALGARAFRVPTKSHAFVFVGVYHKNLQRKGFGSLKLVLKTRLLSSLLACFGIQELLWLRGLSHAGFPRTTPSCNHSIKGACKGPVMNQNKQNSHYICYSMVFRPKPTLYNVYKGS